MKKIYLVDWNSFIYRMFFGLPEFSTKDWKIVNAIFWMAKFFVKQLVLENPDYIIFIKDAKWKNFRHELYKDYKATRDRMPDNLRSQILYIEKMIWLMWVPIIEIPWYEADDVIWTLAVQLWVDKDFEIDILTWDKDLYSLVSDNVKIYDTMKNKKFWLAETREKFWVDSSMIINYLAIVWDKADNIPWIDWFWPKKAVELINHIGWIDEIYSQVDLIESWQKKYSDFDKALQSCFKWKTFDKLLSSKQDALLSKKLATIHCNVDLWVFDLENYKFNKQLLLNDKVKDFFRSLEFNSLIWEDTKKLSSWKDLWLSVNIIWDEDWIIDLQDKIVNYNDIIFDTETTSLNIIEAQLVWLSIYLDDTHIYYINRLHDWPKVNDEILQKFITFLLNSDKTLVAHNLKHDLQILELYVNNSKKNNSQENLWQMSLL